MSTGRDIVAEISAGVDEMLAGAVVPTHVVEVTEAVHARRMSGKTRLEFATMLGVSLRTSSPAV